MLALTTGGCVQAKRARLKLDVPEHQQHGHSHEEGHAHKHGAVDHGDHAHEVCPPAQNHTQDLLGGGDIDEKRKW